jgi:hypothetical protein
MGEGTKLAYFAATAGLSGVGGKPSRVAAIPSCTTLRSAAAGTRPSPKMCPGRVVSEREDVPSRLLEQGR